jgi:8-oxo-dGTP pyrophosphatase MutT (NUDIX family)
LTKLHFDPELLPIDSLAGEDPVHPERFALAWLRERFARPPEWMPETTDEHRMREQSGGTFVKAAVLVPLVDREGELTLLLTQRTEHLTDHSGQVSLPGGRVEESDSSIIETALREAREEIGLDARHVEVIGVLPDYFTSTGYCVTPVVAIVHPPVELMADPNEVAEIFEVPLAFLMNGMNHQLRTVILPDGVRQRTFYAMPYDRYFIWGATAGMLRNLFHFLRA